MNKLAVCLFSFVFSIALGCCVFGADVKIESAVLKSDGNVSVECSINSDNNQQITVMVVEADGSGYDKGALYVDQFMPDISEGKFLFSFMTADYMDKNKSYIVRVGGSNIEKVDSKMLVIRYDINGDGVVSRTDLLQFAKYFANWDVEINMYASDVNGDGQVNRGDLLQLGKYFAGWDI